MNKINTLQKYRDEDEVLDIYIVVLKVSLQQQNSTETITYGIRISAQGD